MISLWKCQSKFDSNRSIKFIKFDRYIVFFAHSLVLTFHLDFINSFMYILNGAAISVMILLLSEFDLIPSIFIQNLIMPSISKCSWRFSRLSFGFFIRNGIVDKWLNGASHNFKWSCKATANQAKILLKTFGRLVVLSPINCTVYTFIWLCKIVVMRMLSQVIIYQNDWVKRTFLALRKINKKGPKTVFAAVKWCARVIKSVLSK